jgi:hypothetical protein
MRRSLIGSVGGAGTQGGGRAPHFRARFASCLFPESSRTFHIPEKLCVALCLYVNLTCWPSLVLFS